MLTRKRNRTCQQFDEHMWHLGFALAHDKLGLTADILDFDGVDSFVLRITCSEGLCGWLALKE